MSFSDDLSDALSGLSYSATVSNLCGGILTPLSGNTFLQYTDGSVAAGAKT